MLFRIGLTAAFRLATLLVLALSCPIAAFAQPASSAAFSFAKIAPVKGAAGDTVWVDVTATMKAYHYTYSTKRLENSYGLGPNPTKFASSSTSIAQILKGIKNPKPKVVYDEGFEMNIEKLQGTFTWKIPIRLGVKLVPGTYRANIQVIAQVCDTVSCFPPEEFPVPLAIEITKAATDDLVAADTSNENKGVATPSSTGGGVAGEGAKQQTTAVGAQEEIEIEKSKGLLSFFLYAMGIGFLALLTPCVFPMIPITVSFFTKRDQKSRFMAVRDASIFALGIISTFTIVGILASALFGPTAVQDLAANPILNFTIAGLFILLAFNLFGAFEIQIPTSILNKLNRKTQGTGVVAIVMMGFVFSLTSFTCTVPFVGTVLLGAAGGSYLFPIVGMLGFAAAFALPFFFLALFPSLLSALPRAGGWMNNMKVVMGFIEIAFALKFISTAEFVLGWGILPREPFLAVWTGVFMLIGLYLLGLFKMKLDTPLESVSALRAVFAVVFVSLGFWFSAGMLGRPLAADIEALLPPENYREMIDGTVAESKATATQADGNAGHSTEWYRNLDEAKAEAKRTGKPIFIDFTGFACTNCRLMEKTVFTKPAVKEEFKKFVLVQLYTDRKEEPYVSNQNLMKSFGTVANPLYVILQPNGTYVAQTGFLPRYRGNPSEFIGFLQKGLP